MAVPQFTNLNTKRSEAISLTASAVQVDTGAKVVYAMEIDNRENSDDVYVKLYNNASPTIGTTGPNHIECVPGGERSVVDLNAADGVSFGTALAAACVTTPGTGGTTSPTNPVPVTFYTD